MQPNSTLWTKNAHFPKTKFPIPYYLLRLRRLFSFDIFQKNLRTAKNQKNKSNLPASSPASERESCFVTSLIQKNFVFAFPPTSSQRTRFSHFVQIHRIEFLENFVEEEANPNPLRWRGRSKGGISGKAYRPPPRWHTNSTNSRNTTNKIQFFPNLNNKESIPT